VEVVSKEFLWASWRPGARGTGNKVVARLHGGWVRIGKAIVQSVFD